MNQTQRAFENAMVVETWRETLYPRQAMFFAAIAIAPDGAPELLAGASKDEIVAVMRRIVELSDAGQWRSVSG